MSWEISASTTCHYCGGRIGKRGCVNCDVERDTEEREDGDDEVHKGSLQE